MTSIEERIKKLLRLAKSDNPHEAENALQRAFELAQKHRLSIEELDLEKDLEAIAEKAFPVGLRIGSEYKQAASILNAYFNVRCVLSNPSILIFGTESEITVAEYVLDFLVWAVRAGLKDFKLAEKQARRKWFSAKRSNYIKGFFYALHSKLCVAQFALSESSETALAIHKNRLQDFVDQRFGNSLVKIKAPKTRGNRCAMEAGWDKGQKTNIRQPIAGQPKAAIEPDALISEGKQP